MLTLFPKLNVRSRPFSILWRVLWTLLLTTRAQGEFIVHSWENQFPRSSYELGLNSDYFVTGSNFSNSGSVVNPSGFTSYAKLQSDLQLRLKITDRLGVFGRGSWSYVNLISSSKGGTGFGFGDQSLGLVLRIAGFTADAAVILDLQGQVDVPGYNNSTSFANQTPYLGDGSLDLTGGIFATINLLEGKKYKFQTAWGAGYTYRSDGFSSAVPWSVFFKLIPQLYGGTFDLGTTGFLSLQTDISLSYNTPHSNLVSGGSFITGAIDPTLIQLIAKAGYKFNPSSYLNLRSKLNLAGQNTPAGYTVAFELQFLFGAVKESHIEKQLAARITPELDPSENNLPTFTTYSMDANITKTNIRLNLVKINKGSQDGIVVGQIFDIFDVKVGNQGGEAIARAQVTHVKAEETALEITEFYKEVPIEEGFVVKRLIQ